MDPDPDPGGPKTGGSGGSGSATLHCTLKKHFSQPVSEMYKKNEKIHSVTEDAEATSAKQEDERTVDWSTPAG